jgi:uncharacterized protein with HEPN domain
MKHPERVRDYLEHIMEAIDRATAYLQPLQDIGNLEQNLRFPWRGQTATMDK